MQRDEKEDRRREDLEEFFFELFHFEVISFLLRRPATTGDRPRKHERANRRIDQRQRRDDGLKLLVHVCFGLSILTKLVPALQSCYSKGGGLSAIGSPSRR